jgi:hypothetical protein
MARTSLTEAAAAVLGQDVDVGEVGQPDAVGDRAGEADHRS